MIHTCLTSHIYLNWCFDLSACFDQVWEDSLIADADQKKFSFSPRWTCCRAGIFFVNYKLFTIQAIFLLNHLLRIDGNRYVYKLMHSNQWCILSRETIFNLNCYNSLTLYMGDANPLVSLCTIVWHLLSDVKPIEQRKFYRLWHSNTMIIALRQL